jgi:hypothetical protein
MFSKKWCADCSSLKSKPRYFNKAISSTMEDGVSFAIAIKRMTR